MSIVTEMTTDIDEFRREVAGWFAENTPTDWVARSQAMDDEQYLAFQLEWIAALADRGYSAPSVPREWGGGELTVRQQIVLFEEWARAGAPDIDTFIVSLHHVPATLLAFGTEEQRRRYIPGALRGVIWCQGFSEPGAGSDLASLRTRAEQIEGGWRVTGQKIWSSNADVAEYCILLARSAAGSERSKGISYFILDMHADGVEVRPIVQNTGHHEFSEVFLDNVFIPSDQIIGEEGDGWRVAQETLAAERGPAGFDVLAKAERILERLEATTSTGPGDSELRRLRERLVNVKSLALDLVDALEEDRDVEDLTSAVKIAQSELVQQITGFELLTLGADGLLDVHQRHPRGWISGDPYIDWLRSWAWTIAGGTNEIQRNIIAERVLGMPREVRPTARAAGA